MSILIGGNKANKMYWGSTPVSKVFWGATKVWPSTAPLWVVGAYKEDRAIFRSRDGITWTQNGSALSSSNHSFDNIVYGNGMFVGVGSSVSRHPSSTNLDVPVIYYSRDGITWTQATLPSTFGTGSGAYRFIAYGDGTFMTVPWSVYSAPRGQYGLKSTDGVTWTAFRLPTDYKSYHIGFGAGKFVLMAWSVSQNEEIWYSTNKGSSWTAGTAPTDKRRYTSDTCDIVFGNGMFLMPSGTASSGYESLKSTDGINWSWCGTPPYGISSIIFDGTRFVGVSGRQALISTDGTTWSSNTLPPNDYWYWNKIAYGNGMYITTGENGAYLLRSTNATSWTRFDAFNYQPEGSWAICCGESEL